MHFVDSFIDVPVTTEPILVIQPVLDFIQPFFSTVINHGLIQTWKKWFRHMDRRITPENLPEKAQEVHFPDGEVSGAISSLPAKLRMVILLRYYEGFTVQETAETAGVSVATAKRQIRKANQLLRKKLEGWYYDE